MLCAFSPIPLEDETVLLMKHIVTHAEYDKLCRQYAKEADK